MGKESTLEPWREIMIKSWVWRFGAGLFIVLGLCGFSDSVDIADRGGRYLLRTLSSGLILIGLNGLFEPRKKIPFSILE